MFSEPVYYISETSFVFCLFPSRLVTTLYHISPINLLSYNTRQASVDLSIVPPRLIDLSNARIIEYTDARTVDRSHDRYRRTVEPSICRMVEWSNGRMVEWSDDWSICRFVDLSLTSRFVLRKRSSSISAVSNGLYPLYISIYIYIYSLVIYNNNIFRLIHLTYPLFNWVAFSIWSPTFIVFHIQLYDLIKTTFYLS